jgi:hypothetical protein
MMLMKEQFPKGAVLFLYAEQGNDLFIFGACPGIFIRRRMIGKMKKCPCQRGSDSVKYKPYDEILTIHQFDQIRRKKSWQ